MLIILLRPLIRPLPFISLNIILILDISKYLHPLAAATISLDLIVLRVLSRHALNKWLHSLPFNHFIVKDIGLVLQQIEYDVFAVPLDPALSEVADLAVLDPAVGAEAQGRILLRVEFVELLLARQEEPFVCNLSYVVYQTNAVVNVVAVHKPNVLIGHQDALLADGADAVA